MKTIIVDSSIFFNALHASKSESRKFILTHEEFRLCAPNYLFYEIFKHKEHLLKKSKLDESEIYFALSKLLSNVSFINENMISLANALKAYHLCKGIDENDIVFVALALELDGLLWTKDEALKNGLRQKGFEQFYPS